MRRRPSIPRSPLLLVTVGLCLAVAGGCGSSSQAEPQTADPATTVEARSGQVAVSAVDNFFRAETVAVTAGTEVTWTNDGRNDHNVVPVASGGFTVPATAFTPGLSASHTFTEPGTYRYYCSIHGTAEKGMVGTIEVVSP